MNQFHPLVIHLLASCVFCTAQAQPQLVYVEPVNNPTYTIEYKCVAEAALKNSEYTWYRQGWARLPEGVVAMGDRLHFLKWTSDLNGLYICEVENQYGKASGSIYVDYDKVHYPKQELK